MGEVYRARDSRLGRDVAIKVSNGPFSERFEREARAVAALNHPNICTLHDVGPNFLVMELVEGPTLAERMAQGPLPVDKTLRIAHEIAEALAAAHEKGIVHRDLKPANIKLKADGTVKVLDFGLAKTAEETMSPENSPTFAGATGGTQAGMIIGTAAYMAPEQARGKAVDKRADIWAFGVVVYEMLTGQRLFDGETISDTLAAVLKEEPKWNLVAPRFHRLLKSCLERDPKRRLRDIGDFELLIEETAPTPHAPRGWLWPAIASVATIAAIVIATIHFREAPPPEPGPVHFDIAAPEDNALMNAAPVVSPDGRHVAFLAKAAQGPVRLWIRPLDSLEARPIAGSEGADLIRVFWSPDSRSVAFTVQEKLRRAEISGGAAQPLCDLPGPLRGGTWNRAGDILFGSGTTINAGVFRVSDRGGTPAMVTTIDPARRELAHDLPWFLPDGRHFLYNRNALASDHRGIYVGSLDAKPDQQSTKPLVAGVTLPSPMYTPATRGGYLLYSRGGTLLAQPFDADKLALTGEPVELVENTRVIAGNTFSASASTLAYRSGLETAKSQVTVFDRDGKKSGTIGPPANYPLTVQISPDGKFLSLDATDSVPQIQSVAHIFIVDVARGVLNRLIPGQTRDYAGVLSADGRVVFTYEIKEGASGDIYVMRANGAGTPQLLVQSPTLKHPNSWSLDGRYVVYDDHHPTQKQDLWILPMSGNSKPIPFLTTNADETDAAFSPDGKFIAYSSDESGRREVYVRDFVPEQTPATGSKKWQISVNGGAKPQWRRDGKEIYYLDGNQMMAVPVKTGGALDPGLATKLFDVRATGYVPFVVTPDGHFIINTLPDLSSLMSTPITVVLNWQTGLRR
jgi:Tol biopolymer transport system component